MDKGFEPIIDNMKPDSYNTMPPEEEEVNGNNNETRLTS